MKAHQYWLDIDPEERQRLAERIQQRNAQSDVKVLLDWAWDGSLIVNVCDSDEFASWMCLKYTDNITRTRPIDRA